MTDTKTTTPSSGVDRTMTFEAAAGAFCLTVEVFALTLVFAHGALDLFGVDVPYLATGIAVAGSLIGFDRLFRYFRANLAG